jgi:hypothetical protein
MVCPTARRTTRLVIADRRRATRLRGALFDDARGGRAARPDVPGACPAGGRSWDPARGASVPRPERFVPPARHQERVVQTHDPLPRDRAALRVHRDDGVSDFAVVDGRVVPLRHRNSYRSDKMG